MIQWKPSLQDWREREMATGRRLGWTGLGHRVDRRWRAPLTGEADQSPARRPAAIALFGCRTCRCTSDVRRVASAAARPGLGGHRGSAAARARPPARGCVRPAGCGCAFRTVSSAAGLRSCSSSAG
eukprot:364181-Chlamydomonas_euryale.AAC.5